MLRALSKCLLLSALIPCAHASGRLDPTFAAGGVLITSLSTNSSGSDALQAGLIDQAGRYVGVGSATTNTVAKGLIVRFLGSDLIDTSFGTNGIARLPRRRGCCSSRTASSSSPATPTMSRTTP